MQDDARPPGGAAIPVGRLARFARLSGMAGGVAGAVAAGGARSVLQGTRPNFRDLLLTPANARRVVNDLARMRGAAMKLGQLLSLDDGALLPPELADIFARLRDSAEPMTPKQLKTALTAEWGADFTRHFKRFDPRPLAAASIGQVHRAVTRDGRDLAIKVQYPGVQGSIDSDIATLGGLLRMPGLLPAGVDLTELLEAARRQLHDEADYLKEADHLERFGGLLAGDADAVVPEVHRDLTTTRVLAMTYVDGQDIAQVADCSEDERNRVVALMITLTLRELFEFRLMQTDPNFANFRYQPDTGRIVLLDFGATMAFPQTMVDSAREVLHAAMAGDLQAVGRGLARLGVVDPEGDPHHYAVTMDIVAMAMEPLNTDAPFDIAASDLTTRLMEAGFEIPPDQALRHLPPHELLFLQRKLAGLYLLAAKLKAQIPVRACLAPFLDQPSEGVCATSG